MFSEFLTQLFKRIIKIVFSYVSWQTNEIYFNPSISLGLFFGFFVMICSVLL